MKVKSDNCDHSYKEVCNNCIDFKSVIPKGVLNALKSN